MENENSVDKLPETIDSLLHQFNEAAFPAPLKKNVFKAIGNLIAASVDVPIAWLEAQADKKRAQAEGLRMVTNAASYAASKEFLHDAELANRAVNHFGSRLLKEQLNREKIARGTLSELKSNNSTTAAEEQNAFRESNEPLKEIDDDWLEMFSRLAETKSSEEIQLFFSKILAGEIQKPGTFSAKSIHTLALLDQESGQLFQKFCSASYYNPIGGLELGWLFSEPIGDPNTNALKDIGLSFLSLTKLQEAGLITSSLTILQPFPPSLIGAPFLIGNVLFQFSKTENSPTEGIRCVTVQFTKVGAELRNVANIDSNALYIEKFVPWFTEKFKAKLERQEVVEGN